MTADELEVELGRRVAALVDIDPDELDPDAYLDELGLSSRDAVVLAGQLEELLGRSVSATVAWEAPSIRALAALLSESEVAEGRSELRLAPAVPEQTSDASPDDGPVGDGVPAGEDGDRIAIVGLGCRLPGGVDDPATFWELLRAGRDVIGEVPAERWERAGLHLDDDVPRHGAFLDDVSGFDAEYFGITPREAALMDPQQRLLLETSVDALRHARLDPTSLRGSRTGVFVGISGTEYGMLTATRADLEFWTATGGALSIAANRISYALDLRGPSVALDSACSSSLTAVHTAATALRAGDCSLALVGGVNVLLTPLVTAAFARGGVLAPDGRCKSFGTGADGIGRGEGCGVLVLERLADARRHGHRVLAVVAGSAVNSDGRSNGLAAPNGAAQEDVLRRAYEAAGIAADGVDYVEAHGTGTELGDPIEAAALGRVLGAGRPVERPLLLGSVKSNLGHLEAAAGIVSIIKVVLALRHDQLPATLHADVPGAHLDLDGQRLALVTSPRPWPRYSGRARAGVSGFGFGGTNAHVVLEQAEPAPESRSAGEAIRSGVAGQHVFAVTGRTAPRVRATATRLAEWLADSAGATDPAAVARSLAGAVPEGSYRMAVAAADTTVAAAQLRRAEPAAPAARVDRPVFVFSGYGQQWDGMAAGLLASEPAFAAAVDEACDALAEHGCPGIADLLRAGRPAADMVETMAALFAIQLGLAAWWRSRGVEPAAVVGQSLGEVAAAVVAGALTLHDGAHVMVARARLLAEVDARDAGAMALLDLPADEVRRRIATEAGWQQLEVAVIAAPDQCTVGGPAAQVRQVVEQVEAEGGEAWLLKVATAGHTCAVEPVLAPLRTELSGLRGRAPDLEWYGTVLDDPRSVPPCDAGYWADNVRRPVRFADAVTAALADGHDTFVELSAHAVAAGALRRTVAVVRKSGKLPESTPIVIVASMRRDDEAELARAVAGLYAAGHAEVLQRVEPAGPDVDVPLPPWLRRDFWFTPRQGAGVAHAGSGGAAGAIPAGLTLPEGAVLADGAVRVWTSDLTELPGTRSALDVVEAAALALAAARTAGVTGEVRAVTLDDAPRDGAALLSCTRTDAGAEIEMLHRGAGTSWVRSLHARVASREQSAAPRPSSGGSVSSKQAPEQSFEPSSERPSEPPSLAALPVGGAVGAVPPAAEPESVLQRLRLLLSQVMDGGDPGDQGDPADWIADDIALVDLGLDSLMAARARHGIETEWGVTVPARLLVQGMTLRGLAEHVSRESAVSEAEPAAAGSTAPAVSSASSPASVVAPRDPSERFLVTLWSEELGRDLGVTTDLRPLVDAAPVGAVERVRAAILERAGACPDAATLLAATTVEAMADLLRADIEEHGSAGAAGRHEVVRTLRAGAPTRRPLLVFHPAGGTCAVYRPLLQQLDPELPVIGFDRLGDTPGPSHGSGAQPGLGERGGERVGEWDSIELRAEHYVELLRRRVPHGPYRLLGWSFGGLLAGECAQRLRAAGEEVELLASIDTALPEPDPTRSEEQLLTERFQRFADHLERTYGASVTVPPDIARADDRTQLRLMREAMLAGGVRLPAGVLRHQLMSYADARLAERYVPPPWDGELVLYRAREVEELTGTLDPRYRRTDATLGWDRIASELTVVPVPGDHITMIDRPHVDVLARDLRARLARLDEGRVPVSAAALRHTAAPVKLRVEKESS